MKYKIGDILMIKNCEYQSHPYIRLRSHLRNLPTHDGHLPDLINTVGIITDIEKHTDIFESESTENDNGYIWLSQIDGKQYYFYENEVEGEVF
jgi:hypothetical protein